MHSQSGQLDSDMIYHASVLKIKVTSVQSYWHLLCDHSNLFRCVADVWTQISDLITCK